MSTISSAGCPAASIALRTAAMSEVTPVEVSLCTTQTALMRRSPVLGAGAPRSGRPGRRGASRRLGSSASLPAPARNSVARPEPRRHLLPQRGEVAGLEHQHAVARAQRVDQRRLPGAGARGRIDDDRMAGLEDLAGCRPAPCGRARRTPARDGRSSAGSSPAGCDPAPGSGRGSAGSGGRSGGSRGRA